MQTILFSTTIVSDGQLAISCHTIGIVIFNSIYLIKWNVVILVILVVSVTCLCSFSLSQSISPLFVFDYQNYILKCDDFPWCCALKYIYFFKWFILSNQHILQAPVAGQHVPSESKKNHPLFRELKKHYLALDSCVFCRIYILTIRNCISVHITMVCIFEFELLVNKYIFFS